MLLQLKEREGRIKLDSNLYWILIYYLNEVEEIHYCLSQQLHLPPLFEQKVCKR